MAIIWSVASFSFYFIAFYESVIPVKNIFLVAAIIGLADVISTTLMYVVARKIALKISLALSFVLLIIGSFGLWITLVISGVDDPSNVSQAVSLTLTALVFLTRAAANIIFALAYWATAALTPP